MSGYRKWLVLIFIIDWLFLTYFALKPVEQLVNLNHWDKVLHFFAYLQLSALAYFIAVKPKVFIWLCLLIIVYGAAIEFIQSFVPGRQMSLLDFLANLAGVTITAVIAYCWYCRQLRSQPSGNNANI